MPDHRDVIEAAAARLGTRVQRDAPLAPYTTYKVGGAAKLLFRVERDRDLEAVVATVQGTAVDTLVIGKGSNLLVADAGFDGLALVLGEAFAAIETSGTLVRAGGAALLPVVARRSVQASLTGFEWAVGVPGSVGGGVRMNAGGHGSDMAASLERVRVLDLSAGQDEEVEPTALDLRYRHSAVGPDQVVLRADIRLARGDRDASQAELAEIVRWRREHQPGGPNAGSVFTNPPGDSAGRLIDAAGLKGFRHGTAQVSPKHANFIQADEGGSADDVLALMAIVRERVRDQTGIELVAETRLVGFASDHPRSGVEGP